MVSCVCVVCRGVFCVVVLMFVCRGVVCVSVLCGVV